MKCLGIRFPSPKYGINSGGTPYIQGHVEILHNGEWGTICDDGFDDNAATVLCKMFNSSKYNSGKYSSAFKQKDSIRKAERIWLDELDCSNNASDIKDCEHNEWGNEDCGHSDDVGIRCFFQIPPTNNPLQNHGKYI